MKLKQIGMFGIVLATILIGAGIATADNNTTGTTTSDLAWLWAILGGLLQLIIGIALAIASIYLGLNVLSRLMPKINIWEEVKKGNYAVGIVCAGVVIAYTQVITSGIRGMTTAITTNPSLLGFVAALISVLIGILLASLGITLAFKALDKLTKNIDETEELNKKNLAVGILIAGILYGVSSMISAAVSGIGGAVAAAMGAGNIPL
ncbi:MAG: DUF350 domain-containing protein [Thermoplasmata archaeon]|nr:DUF350 domain-containing protein [Thermoplasmata archaeon]